MKIHHMELDLSPHVVTLSELAAAFAAAGYDPPHVNVESLAAPYFLVHGDLTLDDVELRTGTLVVTGRLTISHALFVQRDGRPLANIIVLGDCQLGVVYLDGFLVVRGALMVHTFIGDTTWDGGLFVDGDTSGERMILHDMGDDLAGENLVALFATSANYAAAREAIPELFDPPEPGDDLGKANPVGYFFACRDRERR